MGELPDHSYQIEGVNGKLQDPPIAWEALPDAWERPRPPGDRWTTTGPKPPDGSWRGPPRALYADLDEHGIPLMNNDRMESFVFTKLEYGQTASRSVWNRTSTGGQGNGQQTNPFQEDHNGPDADRQVRLQSAARREGGPASPVTTVAAPAATLVAGSIGTAAARVVLSPAMVVAARAARYTLQATAYGWPADICGEKILRELPTLTGGDR